MNQPVTIYFELEPDANSESIKTAVKSRLGKLENIQDFDVQEPQKRLTGAEVVAVIGVAVLIANSAKDALDALTGIIKSLKELSKEVKGLKDVIFETKEGRKTLDEVRAQDLA